MIRNNGLGRARFPLHGMAAALAIGWAGSAMAIELDTGNPDLRMRWDNTVRYNLGMRMEGQDRRLLNNPNYDESDSKFGKGSVVTNRVDWLSELDLSYRGQFGARVTGAAWYDNAYDDHSVHTTAPGGALTSYRNSEYNSTVKRYVNGPSGELLDAFVWANMDIGAVPLNVKVGRHTNIWGEGLLIGGHAISYSQSPVDGVKAVTSPGIETKEVFLPVGQVSGKAQVTDRLSIAGQYFYEWEPTRVPHAGTYLMGADTAPTVDRLPNNWARAQSKKPGGDGNWGVAAKLNIEEIESTFGAYYREFNDYAPETGVQYLGAAGPFRFVYPEGVRLLGLSFARVIGPVSFGSELSMRKNGHLNSTGVSAANNTGARGDTWHAIVNGVYMLPKTSFWDTGTLVAELAYSRLDQVTKNPELYKAVGYNCAKVGGAAGNKLGNKMDGCSTDDFAQIAINFTPQYLNIFPSWDMDVPLTVNYGLSGNAPSGGGGFERLMSWSMGVKMTYASRYEFTLRYADMAAATIYNAAGTTALGGNGLSSAVGATDRGWLTFTFKTAF
ncbi:MAG: DUF1302 family protein [Rhodoferax sp.]|jgi:hypothetical protein|nr:DUF1302 family protein [Rhodoferax sp.]